MKHLITLAALITITGCNHTSTTSNFKPVGPHAKLEDFFYPPPEGVSYHPRWNRPPPFWPPDEHLAPIDDSNPPIPFLSRYPDTVVHKVPSKSTL